MRVLVFSQYYYPEGVPKPHELAEALHEKNHQVAVITGFPHYPGGKLKKGYRLKLFLRETINRIPVLRTFEIPSHSTNSILRTANYLSFMISAPFGAFFTPKCDVMYVWHPPLTVGVAAWLTAKIKRIPFVYDVQDIWPDTVIWAGMMSADSLQVKIMRRLERFVYRRAAHLIVQTEAGRLNLIQKGVAADKISVLQNWIDEDLFDTDSLKAENLRQRQQIREELQWGDSFIVLFAGNLGLLQGLETAIKAAQKLPDKNYRLVFVGDGTDKLRLEQLAIDLNVGSRVQFIERQPIERMPALMFAADALLVHLKKSEVADYVVPSKTIAYLASGKPILMAAGGASADLIQTARAGLTCEPENADQLTEAIIQMQGMSAAERAAFGASGKQYLNEHLSKKQLIAAYENLLLTVAQKWQNHK